MEGDWHQKAKPKDQISITFLALRQWQIGALRQHQIGELVYGFFHEKWKCQRLLQTTEECKMATPYLIEYTYQSFLMSFINK